MSIPVIVLFISYIELELDNSLNAQDGDYYCKNCLYSIRTESKLKSRENVCKDLDYCHM